MAFRGAPVLVAAWLLSAALPLRAQRFAGSPVPVDPTAAVGTVGSAAAAIPSLSPQGAPRPVGTRPVVALVLSGGGARGAAHVGVLEALQDARVPVDLVVGTSMGAVVGGLYASGVTAAEMRAWLERVDWSELFDDGPEYRELPIRRKRRERDFPIGLELGVGRRGLQVPPGLITGQKLSVELRHLMLPVAGVARFDELPIPFRAVATDLASGEMVVLGGGDLVGAVRASMSVPGVFTPYAIDGRPMVDGGVLRNVPVDVARRLGAEVLIVVDISSPLQPTDQLRSAVDVALQASTIATITGSAAHVQALGPADVLIRPELGDMSGTAFDRSLEAVAFGRHAADEVRDRLSVLSVDSAAYDEWWRSALLRRRTPGVIDYLQTGSTYRRASRTLLRRVHVRPGEPLDTALLGRDLRRIYDSGIYDLVDYHIVADEGEDVLVVDAREKAWGPNYLRFRVSIADDLSAGGTYSLATMLLVPEVNRRGGELETLFQMGDTRALRLLLHQPLDRARRVFVEPWLSYSRVPAPSYEGDRLMARYRLSSYVAGVAAGVELGGLAEFRLGFERGELRADPEVPEDLPDLRAASAALSATFELDHLDDPFIPREGYAVELSAEHSPSWLGADHDHDAVVLSTLGGVRHGAYSALAGFLAGSSLATSLPDYGRFGFGGLFLLSGYRPGEIQGNHGALARLFLMRDLAGPKVVGAITLEAGDAWQERHQIGLRDPHLAASLALGLHTPVGPVYLAWGFGEGGRRQAYLLVGRGL